MDEEKLFDECIAKAIEIGNKYMNRGSIMVANKKVGDLTSDKPTKEEWDLALVLFQKELQKK